MGYKGNQGGVESQSEWRSAIMKFLLVLSLALAAVQAEADPAFAYSVGGHYLPYGLGVHAVHAVPAVHAVHAVRTPLVYTHHTGCQNAAGAVVPCALGGVSLLGVAPAPVKEEADAEADPWLLYGGHYGGHVYGGHYGYGYHHALPYYYLGGCRNYLGGAVPCA